MALNPTFPGSLSGSLNVFGKNDPASAQTERSGLVPANPASAANTPPESGNSTDTFESGTASILATEIMSGFSITTASGVYRPLNSSQNNNSLSFGFGSSGFDSLRDTLGGIFGAQSALLDKFSEASEWLWNLDSDLYEGFMLILKILAEDSPELAEKMVASLHQMSNLFAGAESGGATDTAASATVSVTNIVASMSAVVSESFSQTADGSISMSFRFEGEVFVMSLSEQGDPLVLDLDGDGIDLRAVEDGVDFDLEGTGEKVRSAFVQGDDALLFVDLDGNGTLSGGRELFGDQEGDEHGFAELARHDLNHDGRIDALDEIFAKLRLFREKNTDGANSRNETLTLEQAGIESIGLGYTDTNHRDGKGNTITQISSFTRRDGSKSMVADAMLRFLRKR